MFREEINDKFQRIIRKNSIVLLDEFKSAGVKFKLVFDYIRSTYIIVKGEGEDEHKVKDFLILNRAITEWYSMRGIKLEESKVLDLSPEVDGEYNG